MPYLKDKFVGGTVKLETPRSVWTAGCCVWTEPGNVYGNLEKSPVLRGDEQQPEG